MNRLFTIVALVCASALFAGAQAKKASYLNAEAERLGVATGDIGGAEYIGTDKDVARAFETYSHVFDYKFFFPYDEESDTLTVDRKKEILDRRFADFKADVEKVSSPDMKQFLTVLGDDAYLNYYIRMEEDSVKLAALYDKIDINSWIGLYNYLPVWKIQRSLPQPDFDGDMVPYGLAYIEAIRSQVTDEAVRDAMLASCARLVLDWGKTADVDAFWIPFRQFAGDDNKVVKRYASKVESLKKTRTGSPAIDVEFTATDGRKLHLSDLYGKVLYIDVWATWCGPCRKEIPYVEKHVEYYKGNDRVRFVSISFDEDRDAWLELLAKDKPQWEQYNTDPEQHRAMSKAYGISGIPRFIIVNADGTIRDADAFRPSDPDFHAKLDKIINDQK